MQSHVQAVQTFRAGQQNVNEEKTLGEKSQDGQRERKDRREKREQRVK